MDELLFRSSQKLENLQHTIGVAANEGKHFLQEQGIQAKDQLVYLMRRTRLDEIQHAAQRLITSMISLAKEIKQQAVLYIQPQIFYRELVYVFSRRWTRGEIYIGCTGLLVGGIAGYFIGTMMYKNRKPVAYMRAIQCSMYGDIEAVTVVEDAIAPQECGEDEVLVSVKAASVNLIDFKISQGYGRRIRKFMSKYFKNVHGDLPVTLGRACTGIVIEVGQNVGKFEIGDEVWLTSPFWAPGTFSETVLVRACSAARKPRSIGFEGGCSLPYAGGIALTFLEKANIDKSNANGTRIFIHGACTPVGCILVQILKSWNAHITSTCYARSVPVAKALGVNDIIVIKENEEDVSQIFKELELRDSFNKIFLTIESNISLLQKFETHVNEKNNIFMTYPQPLSFDENDGLLIGPLFGIFMQVKCFLNAILGEYPFNFGEPHICCGTLDKIADMVSAGTLQTVVDKVYSLQEIDKALHHIQSSDSIGSTVITFR